MTPPDGQWWDPPFTNEDLDHHQKWLNEHGQKPKPTSCPICAALIKRVAADHA